MIAKYKTDTYLRPSKNTDKCKSINFINQNSVSIIGSINIDIDHFHDVSQIIIPPSFLIDSNFITVSEPSSLGDIISKEMVCYCKPC